MFACSVDLSHASQLFQRLGETDSEQFNRERREDREDRMLDAIEETAANPAWRNTYNFVQGQVEYSTNYPSASEERTPPSTHIYNSGYGSGSGSGSGSAGVGPQVESSRAAYIIPGQPSHHMEIEDPQVITYPLPVAQTSHITSTGRQDAPFSSRHGSSVHDRPVQAPQTYNTYPEQEYLQEQYPMEQYPQEQYPQEQYPEEQQAEQQDLEQQYVAPHRRRHSTRSSSGRRDSGRQSKCSGCCIVM
ncbi:hypothetical protein LA080_008150 [Diaporthe eres]|nr:hypothetical protein LA080_008150 [Diaporthe eres]